MCRVIDTFVDQLDMDKLNFERAIPADTGRPGYDPHAQAVIVRLSKSGSSSRRLEAECHRNVEVMWQLDRLHPDYKSISEFRRRHREEVTAAGAELVRFC